ncbi:MAG: flagellar hook-length control protein FliK [Roseibium sp.]
MVETVNAQILPAGKTGGAAPQGLEPGTELRAKVEANLPNGVVRLATTDAKIDLKVPSPLPVGGDVTVTVSGSKQQPAVQITTSNPQASPPPSEGAQSSGTAKPASVPSPQQPPATGAGTLARPAPVLTQIIQAGGSLPVGAAPAGSPSTAPVPQTPATAIPPGGSGSAPAPPLGNPSGPGAGGQAQPAHALPPGSAVPLPAGAPGSGAAPAGPVTTPNLSLPSVALPNGVSVPSIGAPPTQGSGALPTAGVQTPQNMPSGGVPLQSSGQPSGNLTANSPAAPAAPALQSGAGQSGTTPQTSAAPLPAGGFTGGSQGAGTQPILNAPLTGQLASTNSSATQQSGASAKSFYPVQGASQATTASTQVASTGSSPLQQAADTVRQPLAEQQAGAGALFAQIGSLMSAQGAGKVSLPDSVQQAMQQILGLRIGGGQTSGQASGQVNAQGGLAQNLQKAVLQSGQFREAALLRPGGGASGPSTDLKSALLAFKGLLHRFGAEAQIVKPAQQPAVPSKKGSPQGQAQQAASGTGGGSTPQVLQSLLQSTDATLARMRLTQLVNSGLVGDDGPQTTASKPMDIVLELPLAFGQETAVMQMQVGRDGGGVDDKEDGEPAWRLRFALDLTATGPLEAAISLRGSGTYVSLWVDRKDTLETLKGLRETMEASFAHAGLDLQELRFIRGLPPRTAAKYGSLIDRQS